MKYKVVIDNWTSGLNELLNHQEKRYDPRTHRMRVYNTEKVKNERKIRSCLQKQGLDKVRIENLNVVIGENRKNLTSVYTLPDKVIMRKFIGFAPGYFGGKELG